MTHSSRSSFIEFVEGSISTSDARFIIKMFDVYCEVYNTEPFAFEIGIDSETYSFTINRKNDRFIFKISGYRIKELLIGFKQTEGDFFYGFRPVKTDSEFTNFLNDYKKRIGKINESSNG